MNTRSNLSIFKNQGTAVEVTVVQQLDQDKRTKCAVYHFVLDFLVLFYQEKST